MKSILLTLLLSFSFIQNIAQTNFSHEFTGYGRGASTTFNVETNCLNINPSMLAISDSNYVASITFLDSQLELQGLSGYLLTDAIKNLVSGNDTTLPLQIPMDIINDSFDTSFSFSHRASLHKEFQHPAGFNFGITKLGVFFNFQNKGNIGITLKEEFDFNGQFSEELVEMIAYGQASRQFDSLVLQDGKIIPNDSVYYTNEILGQIFTGYANNPKPFAELSKGTRLEIAHYNTLTIGYGTRIKNLLIGANINAHKGLAYFTFDSDGKNISSTFVNKESPLSSKGAGHGASLSIAATYIIDNNLKIALALNNFGGIRWGGTKNASSKTFTNDSILNNFRLGSTQTSSFVDQWYDEVAVSTDFFHAKTEHDVAFWRPLPSRVNIGVGYTFGTILEIGADISLPTNPFLPNSPGPVASFGAQLNTKFITLRGGISYEPYYKTRIPLGLSFGGKKSKMEVGFAFSDLLLINNKPDQFNNKLGVGAGFKLRI